jgi:hypothetical protein
VGVHRINRDARGPHSVSDDLNQRTKILRYLNRNLGKPWLTANELNIRVTAIAPRAVRVLTVIVKATVAAARAEDATVAELGGAGVVAARFAAFARIRR